MNSNTIPSSFIVKDCTIATMATGVSAGSLIDLREKILTVPVECIYYHFWITRLRPHFVHSGYHNDFAVWAHYILNEAVLAEKLSILDPLRFTSLEDLRSSIIEIIDEALDEKITVAWTSKDHFFHFLISRLIITNTLIQFERPESLLEGIDKLSTSSIFYHFINSRRHFEDCVDDFSVWLNGFGPTYEPLVKELLAVDIYFLTLIEIKNRVCDIIHKFFKESHGLS